MGSSSTVKIYCINILHIVCPLEWWCMVFQLCLSLRLFAIILVLDRVLSYTLIIPVEPQWHLFTVMYLCGIKQYINKHKTIYQQTSNGMTIIQYFYSDKQTKTSLYHRQALKVNMLWHPRLLVFQHSVVWRVIYETVS